MPLFTRDLFNSVAKSRAGTKTFSRLMNEAKMESLSSKTTSAFLSHSHLDKELIEEANAFFKGLNISIYIDWMDETMPEKTSGATATKIKSKIITNDKFVLLATNNAIASKWCNWELGIGDTFKASSDKLLILPLADNRGHWTGNEFLQIYPRVEPVTKDSYSFYDNIFRVIYPDGRTKWIDEWLKS
ncbi:MAG TPA: toll/interleukin-1 receptor domain-containing protein [Panacibacter sp.]|jgi:hypothetical protein|nr:toll/interleukin-1 receptor domain-containing protein [Panacibacter sp.]